MTGHLVYYGSKIFNAQQENDNVHVKKLIYSSNKVGIISFIVVVLFNLIMRKYFK